MPASVSSFPRHLLPLPPLLALAACGELATAPPAPAPNLAVGTSAEYEIIELGDFGGFSTNPLAINDAGVVVGLAHAADWSLHGFVWNNGVMTDLGFFLPRAINAAGTIAGISFSPGSAGSVAAQWRNGVLTVLPSLPSPWGGNSNEVSGMNEAGTMTGVSNGKAAVWENGTVRDLDPGLGAYGSIAWMINDGGQVVASQWGPPGTEYFLISHGTATIIPTLPGAWFTSLTIMNNRGQVAGVASVPDPSTGQMTKGILWDHGTLTDLGHLPGWFKDTWPRAMNNNGMIVGTANGHAFAWQHGSLVDLGTLGGPSSTAVGINASGVVAGSAQLPSYETHAVVWKQGKITDLGTLGGTYSDVSGIGGITGQPRPINARGEIIGTATRADGTSRAVLWRPRQGRP